MNAHVNHNPKCSKKHRQQNGFDEKSGFWKCDICKGPGEYCTLKQLKDHKEYQCGKINVPDIKGKVNRRKTCNRGLPSKDKLYGPGRGSFSTIDNRWHCHLCDWDTVKIGELGQHLAISHERTENWRSHRYAKGVTYVEGAAEPWKCMLSLIHI